MERLLMALHYGADAVYLAGSEFGMRAAAGNFDDENMRAAVRLCHERNVAVHVTCNTLPRENELKRLPAYLEFLDDAGVDALIVADLGVISMAKKYAPNAKLHISTQLGIVNSETCKAVFDMGASRAVLARELSLAEIESIRANCPKELELEAFVHGAMCVSFSGRCLLSNYLTNRDANRGECAQPCRWKYHLVEEKRPGEYHEITEDGGTYIMNSNDLCMIEHLPELIDAGITSFKLEGRMKSAYYAAAVTNAYRHALDAAIERKPLSQVWIDETEKISHRNYCTGFYFGEPGQYYSKSDSIYFASADVCAVVESYGSDGNATLTQRNKFSLGDQLELLTNDGPPIPFTVEEIMNRKGEAIVSAPHPMMELRMKLPKSCAPLSLLRKLK
ncbi:MAG: peptidase U32 [Firmicutes bacterium HGW-Firmicutes-16]|nr:MAG: peptidase U32 [Firmicutes bacterium HGW-Firmicutes-16]